MTKQEFNDRVFEIEAALEKHPKGDMIVAIGRSKNAICLARKYPLTETLELYVEFVFPFLTYEIMSDEAQLPYG